MKYRIVYLIGGIILGVLAGRALFGGGWFGRPQQVIKTDTVTVVETRDSLVYTEVKIIETDTIWADRYVYRDAPVTQGEDSASIYKDMVLLDSGLSVAYTASVTGRLNWVQFKHINERPDVFKIIERTNTVTNTIDPRGLYLVGGVWSDGRFGVGAAYLQKKVLFQYTYKPTSDINLHGLSVGFKIL